MSFKEAVVLCLRKRSYSIHGRAARPEFWYFALFFTLVNAAVLSITRFIPLVGDLIFAVIFIALLCPLMCAAMRRLHDLNLNGAIAIAPVVLIVLSVLCADLAMRSGDEKLKEAAIYAGMGFMIITLAFVCLFMKPGTSGANRYGRVIATLEDFAAFTREYDEALKNSAEERLAQYKKRNPWSRR